MIVLRLIFFLSIVLAAVVRVSILPRKAWIPIVVCWGVAAVFLTIFMSGLTPGEIDRQLFSKTLVAGEFVELSVLAAIVLSSGIIGKISGYYPGIMVLAPIALLASLASRSFPGLDFMIPALLAGVSVCIISTLLIFLCRFSRLGKESLYKVSFLGILICIIYYGMQ